MDALEKDTRRHRAQQSYAQEKGERRGRASEKSHAALSRPSLRQRRRTRSAKKEKQPGLSAPTEHK
ncbi:UNVERIFIED_CONTAM: hypothetical protein HHA_454780 [Hammondia hammondi]|eukprot:XP_008888386.1 hypothetical protein HHA_454780 [Hammondia hammondi]